MRPNFHGTFLNLKDIVVSYYVIFFGGGGDKDIDLM